jgi:uncharacterized protein YggE
MNRRPTLPLLAILAASAVAQLAAAPPAFAQADASAQFATTTLSLSATGEVQVAPDQAWLRTGVATDAASAAEAVAQNRTKMSAVVTAMAAQGVGGPDVQTSALELTAQYADAGQGRRRLTGYEAHNIVTVRMRDLARVGAVVDALVAVGANEIDGVDFDVADRSPVEDQARRAAVKALEAKAALYADATGYRLKRLVSLSEGGGPVFQPMARMARVVVTGSHVATPVAPGELTVRIDVQGEYELSR